MKVLTDRCNPIYYFFKEDKLATIGVTLLAISILCLLCSKVPVNIKNLSKIQWTAMCSTAVSTCLIIQAPLSRKFGWTNPSQNSPTMPLQVISSIESPPISPEDLKKAQSPQMLEDSLLESNPTVNLTYFRVIKPRKIPDLDDLIHFCKTPYLSSIIEPLIPQIDNLSQGQKDKLMRFLEKVVILFQKINSKKSPCEATGGLIILDGRIGKEQRENGYLILPLFVEDDIFDPMCHLDKNLLLYLIRAALVRCYPSIKFMTGISQTGDLVVWNKYPRNPTPAAETHF